MNMEDEKVGVVVELVGDYEFRVRFDEKLPDLMMDEPEPLGAGRGPNAVRVLAAAIGNCLSASLLFCLRKSKIETRELRTEVRAEIVRNERGRLRVGETEVILQLDVGPEAPDRLGRCLELFEDYCLVTQSVRAGLDVGVSVVDPKGEEIFSSEKAPTAT